MITKEKILVQNPELRLTHYNDFMLQRGIIEKYEPIDFHAHCFDSIESMMPAKFRRQKSNYFNNSFFDLSCYPGNANNFDFNKVGYRKWPKTTFSISGLESLAELLALKGVIPLLQNATKDRGLHDKEQNGIKKMVVLPIQGENGNETQNTINRFKDQHEIIVFASVHPNDKNIPAKIQSYLKQGVKGFKIAPHVWNINVDDQRLINLLGFLSQTKLPVISCSGLAIPGSFKHLPRFLKNSMATQELSKFIPALQRFPDLKLVFAHSGLEQNDQLIEIMKQYPATFSDISTQPYQNIRKMIYEVGADRLLFGSDYPFFNQAFPMLSVIKATDNESDRHKIFSLNAKKILGV